MKPPLIIAHRGGAPHLPDNSEAAFRYGVNSGANWLEFDVRETIDQKLVIVHDKRLEQNGTRLRVAESTLSDLRRMRPGLMTLDEFLEAFRNTLPMNVDMKVKGIEQPVVSALRQHNMIEHVLISSVYSASLWRVKQQEPRLKAGLSRGHLVSSVRYEPLTTITALWQHVALPYPLLSLARFADVDAVMLQHRIAVPSMIHRLHSRGLRVFAWTVDDPNIALRLARNGVDGIATNRPEFVIKSFEESELK